jgi:D-glycero-alpha-D-manno-heptose 1-phosphate guanylyltransferase
VKTEDIPVLLLVGGLGTRLRPVVASTPKSLARVGNLSFLELLLRQLGHQQLRRLVMCTGYLGEQIEDAFGDGSQFGLNISYSKEDSPMGTAGAILLARRHVEQTSEFLVMNGDSFVEVDFRRLVDFHRGHGGIASMVVRHVENTARFGTVHAGSDGRVDRFLEKTACTGPGWVNAGVYVFHTAIFSHIQKCPSSLEHDVFPRLLSRDVFAFQANGLFIDIGTPQDYACAQTIFRQLYDAAADERPAPAQKAGNRVCSGVTR